MISFGLQSPAAVTAVRHANRGGIAGKTSADLS
jgi:hypothetical protein